MLRHPDTMSLHFLFGGQRGRLEAVQQEPQVQRAEVGFMRHQRGPIEQWVLAYLGHLESSNNPVMEVPVSR